jgi:hypothetical protein
MAVDASRQSDFLDAQIKNGQAGLSVSSFRERGTYFFGRCAFM